MKTKTTNQTTPFNLSWKIAGKAGEGVMVISKMVAKICKRHGLQAFNYLEYPSLIKGGHQTGQVFANNYQASCQQKSLDILVTLNKNGFKEHQDEITPETLVIYNSDAGPLDKKKYAHLTKKIIEIPFLSLTKEKTGSVNAANIAILGASAYFLGFDTEISKKIIKDEFEGKNEKIIKDDLIAFKTGFVAAKKLGQPIKKTPQLKDKQILLTGNEAVGLAAIAAGVQFYSAYPMTPATALLHYLAAQQENYPLIVKHSEDEIGAINHALGASFAGVRAMTGSSGGGFALMAESVSLASMAEIPLVILEAQRKGPASGLPTWTEQADLSFVLTAGHGDTQRVVFTPGTVAEHFELTIKAFYLAEKYQIPVFILSDKFILESHQTMIKPKLEYNHPRQSIIKSAPADNSFRRYKITKNGISPRSIPGQDHGLQLTNSYEHDEFGFATEEIKQTTSQVEKRTRKMNDLIKEIVQPYLVGPKKAEVTFVCWGSTINVVSQLICNQSLEKKKTVNVIHLPTVWPFPKKEFTKLAHKAKKLVMIEGNQSGQAERLIKQETEITFADRIHRYDGRPFYVEDLQDWLK
ncbi:2-oxoacid:acceptor oxidoreductase subunit alpha [Patescibacteria group bacterium]|nr:2-oxoacid:acceptor oxidoreductase subunit alpha [Patescibacteria group bacterium]